MSLTREPGRWKRAGKQGTENGLGAAWAKHKSAKPATGTPVKASGCTPCEPSSAPTLPQLQGRTCEGAVKQGGTTEVFRLPSLQGVCPREDGRLYWRLPVHGCGMVPRRAEQTFFHFIQRIERDTVMITRRDFLKVTGVAAAAAALTACGGSSSTASTASSAAASTAASAVPSWTRSRWLSPTTPPTRPAL